MNLSLEPSSHSAARKLRRFMGLLMNTETTLRDLNFDVRDAYRFAVREHERLESALPSNAPLDGPPSLKVTSMVEDIENELHRRMGNVLQILSSGEKSSAYLSEQIVYYTKWRKDRTSDTSEVIAPAVSAASAADPVTMGVTWDRLLALHAQLSSTELPHEFVAPYLVYLAGLLHGLHLGAASNHPSKSANEIKASLHGAAAQSLQDAVAFALQERSQALVTSSSGIPGDTEFQCMFMGVAYAQRNHAEPVHDWLARGNYQANLLRLLFGMGCLAAQDRQARRLNLKFYARIPELTEDSFGSEARKIIQTFQPQST